jgi:hypothetical protein
MQSENTFFKIIVAKVLLSKFAIMLNETRHNE